MGYIVPIVVETGTGLPNSNSYVSVADADLYFAQRLAVTAGGAVAGQVWLPFPPAQPGNPWIGLNQYPQFSYITDLNDNLWVQLVAGTQTSGGGRPAFESHGPGFTIDFDGGCDWYCAGEIHDNYVPLASIAQPYCLMDYNGNVQLLNTPTLTLGNASPVFATSRGVTTADGAGPTANAWVCLGPFVSTNESAIGLPRPSTDQYYNLLAACLIKATFFCDFYWRAIFKGQKSKYQNALAWPRVGATIDEGSYDTAVVFWPGYGKSISTFIIGTNEIPIMLKLCVTELASRCLQFGNFVSAGELAPDMNADTSSVRSTKIGPIEVTYNHDRLPVTVYRFCEMLLAPITRGGGGTVPMARG